MTIIIGIVPGAKAAFACGAWVYPIEQVRNFLAARKPDEVLHAFLEWPIPVQKLMPSVRADHSMGVAQGRIVGLLEAFEVPYTLVCPRVWQKVMFAGTSPELKPKERARIAFQRLFSSMVPLCKGPKGGWLDGRCDALLIAEYGRRQLNGANQ